MSVAIARLTEHFVSEMQRGAVSLASTSAIGAIDKDLAGDLTFLNTSSLFVLGDSPIVIDTPKVEPLTFLLLRAVTLEPLAMEPSESHSIPPRVQEQALRVSNLSPPPEPKRRRAGPSTDDQREPSVHWNRPDTLGMRRFNARKETDRKNRRLLLSSAKIRTGNLQGTQGSRSFQGIQTPQKVTVEGKHVWRNVPYGRPPMELPARAEFWNAFGRVWFEVHLNLPDDFVSDLARSIDWPASNSIRYQNSALVFCSHEQILHRLRVGMNFRTGFLFGPNLQAAVQTALGRMELTGSVRFPDAGIELRLESTPFTMMFAGGKVLVSNAGLRVVDRPDRAPWHLMTISGLCHIGSLPAFPVWSPLPPDDGVICFKTPSDRSWTIDTLEELASLAGGTTGWFKQIRKLDLLFDHLLKQQACDLAITADLPSRQITDISFSVFGDQVQYGERQYVQFTDVLLTWTVIHPFDDARRGWRQAFSATVTLFGVRFSVSIRPPDLLVEGVIEHPPEDEDEVDDDTDIPDETDLTGDRVMGQEDDDTAVGLPYCTQAIRTLLSGAESKGLDVYEAKLESSPDAPFVDVLLHFDPFTDRLRVTGIAATGEQHAWEF